MTDTVSRQTMDNETLPDTWVTTTLGEICARVEKVNPKDEPEQIFTYLDIAAIDNSTQKIVKPKIYSGADAPSRARQLVQAGDVLFSTVRTYLKNIAQVPREYGNQIASTGFTVIRSTPEVADKYLFHLVQTDEFLEPLNAKQRGTSYPAVRDSDVFTQPVALPPLNEQRRIVEKIEELFTKLDAGVRSLKQTQVLLKSYRRSVLKAAVEGELSRKWREAHRDGLEPASELLERILRERREKFVGKKYKEPASPDTSNLPALPDGWEWANLSQFLKEPLRNGHSAKADKDGKVRTLTLTAVTVGDFSEANTKLTGADPNHVSDLWLEPGDIFIERSNTPELVGTAQLYTGERHFAIFPDLLIRARILDGVPASYVELALQSTHARSYFKKSARGISGSMPKISQSTIEAAPIPLPPTQEMKFIVEEVERRLSVVDKLEATVEANLKQAGGLRRSILKRAFSGGLVPQDPDDEPAGALLARIREERQAIERKPRKRRARRDDEAQGRLI
ncbi:MAG: restriction endonuclease subunit S [Rubrobacter sp.]|nr:restriction endonuclease subunit S [Rubrobacter sp.]